MDNNINEHSSRFPSNSWDFDMVIEDHAVQEHNPRVQYDSSWVNYLPQPHQVPSSSSKSPNPLFDKEKGQILEDDDQDQEEEISAMKEMMYKIAAMQPVDIDPATIRKPKRRNVRISDDPQSVAARHRRERISEKIRILQRLVPGGTKMDTASMLDEAIRYVKFLKRQIRQLQSNQQPTSIGLSGGLAMGTWQVPASRPLGSAASPSTEPSPGYPFGDNALPFGHEV